MRFRLKLYYVYLAVISALLIFFPVYSQAEDQVQFTARQCFTLIPSDFFEYTPYPINEKEKTSLAENGISSAWKIDQDTKDLLTIASEDNTTVYLRVFRSKDYAVAAYTTTDKKNFCISELWLINKAGQAIPASLPEEPRAEDFFIQGKKLPPHFDSSCTYCGFRNGLEALPSFSVNGVPQEVERDISICYIWDGKEFTRRMRTITDK